jgi:hypothetical protein
VIATIVETSELLDTVLYSTVSALGLILVFSLGIWGSARFAELSRDERPLAAAAAATVAILGFVASIAAAVLGIVVMATR